MYASSPHHRHYTIRNAATTWPNLHFWGSPLRIYLQIRKGDCLLCGMGSSIKISISCRASWRWHSCIVLARYIEATSAYASASRAQFFSARLQIPLSSLSFAPSSPPRRSLHPTSPSPSWCRGGCLSVLELLEGNRATVCAQQKAADTFFLIIYIIPPLNVGTCCHRHKRSPGDDSWTPRKKRKGRCTFGKNTKAIVMVGSCSFW